MDNLGFFFGAVLGTILGPILGPDRPKRGQDEPKRAIRSFKEPKSCIFKNLKKPPVFEGFWVRRPPKRASRDPRRLSRGTQRAPKPPKKIQKVIKKLVKNSTKNDQKVTKKLGPNRGSFLKISLWPGALFVTSGLLKMLTWRCLKDSLKTVPKWFQNGSRLPKVFKIAPKIRPYKDL